MQRDYRHCLVIFSLAFAMSILTGVVIWDMLTVKHLDYRLPFLGYGGVFRWRVIPVGSMNVSLYWLMQILGVLFMCIFNITRRGQIVIPGWKAVLLSCWMALFGYAGAKLLFIIENIKRIKQSGIRLSGVSFFGAVFIMPFAIRIIQRILHIQIRYVEFMDFCIPAGVMMLAVIRIGCYMQGCCGGRLVWSHGHPFIYPVQLMESTLDFFIMGILLLPKVQSRFKGRLYYLFLGVYGVIRFILEILRKTVKNGKYFFSHGQVFALLCMGVCVTVFKYKRKREELSW